MKRVHVPTVDMRYFPSMEFELEGGRRPELARLIPNVRRQANTMNALHNRPFLPFSHCLVTQRATNVLHSRFDYDDEWRHHSATSAREDLRTALTGLSNAARDEGKT